MYENAPILRALLEEAANEEKGAERLENHIPSIDKGTPTSNP
jgi:hypothetical protein